MTKHFNLKNFFIKFFASFALLFVFNSLILSVVPATALAQTVAPPLSSKDRCEKFKDQFKVGSGKNTINIIGDTPVFCSLSDTIVKVINFLLIISGTVTILFLMIGGFFYVTSAGNEEQAEKGKKILINSIIGLVVIIMSYAIVRIIAGTLSLGK